MRKDLRVLGRSPLALVILLAYPLVVAALVGLVASYANAKPRVALVDEDRLPVSLEIGDRTFHIERDDRSRRRRGDARPARPRRGRAPARIRPDRGDARRPARLRRRPPRDDPQPTARARDDRGRSLDPGHPAGAGARLPAQPGAVGCLRGGEPALHRPAARGGRGRVPRPADRRARARRAFAICSTSSRPGRG